MKCKNEYRGRFESRCPVDERRDSYEVDIDSKHTIQVEDILKYFEEVKTKKVFQEDHAKNLSKLFNADVMITGFHSGIRVSSQVYREP